MTYLRDATHIAMGVLFGALLHAAWVAERAIIPSAGVVVTRDHRCGCPPVNSRGEPYSHCITWQADVFTPRRHECGYTTKEQK